eukprot:1145322-Pelagomonas_calceolata.AAC.2
MARLSLIARTTSQKEAFRPPRALCRPTLATNVKVGRIAAALPGPGFKVVWSDQTDTPLIGVGAVVVHLSIPSNAYPNKGGKLCRTAVHFASTTRPQTRSAAVSTCQFRYTPTLNVLPA